MVSDAIWKQRSTVIIVISLFLVKEIDNQEQVREWNSSTWQESNNKR